MGDKSKIEWTDASWNPVVGCSKVSEGCRNCYAINVANRFNGNVEAYKGLTKIVNGKAEWTGKIRFIQQRLLQPIKWQRPRMIFVNSMSDLFHDDVENGDIAKIFAVMAIAKQHTFQVLTKRPERMREFLQSEYSKTQIQEYGRVFLHADDLYIRSMWPLRNVWFGVSVEDQKTADERIRLLLKTPAAVRWISAEPLLGEIDLRDIVIGCGQRPHYCACSPDAGCDCPKIDWVVAGGESGPHARPSHTHWFRSLRDQCMTAGVPFFFKQWGEHVSEDNIPAPHTTVVEKVNCHSTNDGTGHYVPMWKIGKTKAGRLLDGVEWNQYPNLS